MTYTVDYFINKFEAIPEENWCIGAFEKGNSHCAMGHCGMRYETRSYAGYEAYTLHEMLNARATCINDGFVQRYQQPTPKQRILAALYDVKSSQAVEQVNDIIEKKYCNLMSI